ncbi:uncharacterized protein LOC143855087 isoform X2 [Tasmannia lanceolata]
MGLGSNGKSLEAMSDLQKEDGSDFVGKLDLNLAASRDEEADEVYYRGNKTWSDGMQVNMNQQDHLGPPLLAADVSTLGRESPHGGSHLGTPSASPIPDHSLHPMSNTDKPLFLVDTESYHDGMERGNSDSDHARKSPLHDGKTKENSGDFSGNSQLENSEHALEEMEGRNSDHYKGQLQAPSRTIYSSDDGDKERPHYLGKSQSDNGETEGGNFETHSPGRTPRRFASPMRHMSVSPERSPSTQPTAGKKQSPLPMVVQEISHSPGSSREKNSPSSERLGLDGKRDPSHGRLSPSVRWPSHSPERPARQDSERRDDSTTNKLAASPRRRNLPPGHRRQDRSSSRSPVRHRDPSRSPIQHRDPSRSPIRHRDPSRSPIRHRDSSSGYRRDYRDRSRSRSPYARDRYRRSPRRRYSPRHRSPPTGYHSRRRSPRRRPWSPPPNRSTGVGRPGNNLFIAGFSFVTTERDLERKFSRFGRVTDVRIVRDKRSGDSRGFGFLSLERDEDADAAIRALDQTEWNGRVVLVEKSKTSSR